ncbi:hypothetical protein A2933_01565 [Candidatus Nomurabacteria bacterium RIFCSPLOWO2_01_FULL_46_18]|uniref:Uncharacterized protein n=1 Tax=Candidatus Nomurabacteria bacterium RIFCSPLOWO2_01_FULL_46_18 TaxID=1801783 RepID=A0A1F6XD51_9BACT|nr:MAG: hypothetical protein A2933_01565 [Candidatus Nomurabacteria bacterium RIFCSPLOWO2_01_FULL_46_18]
MKYFIVFLLIAFAGLAVFGAFGLHLGTQNHEGGCIAANAKGIDCPKQNSLLAYITFHIDAYKDFSLASLSNIISVLLLALTLVIFGFLLKPPKLAPFRARLRNFSPPSKRKQKFYRWLSLHENSPNNF